MIPRGERNNNPGNLRVNPANRWQGKLIGTDKRDSVFEEFTTLEYGYRALLITLRTYIQKYRLHTLRQIITRWAPPEDNNDTESYIRQVSKYTGIPIGAYLGFDDEAKLTKLAYAISRVENGRYVGTVEVIRKAWRMI